MIRSSISDRRRDLKKAVRRVEWEGFLAEMPCSPAEAHELFDRLDSVLAKEACLNDLRHTRTVCEEMGLSVDTLTSWLREQGGGCDCEVLANVEERVEAAAGGKE